MTDQNRMFNQKRRHTQPRRIPNTDIAFDLWRDRHGCTGGLSARDMFHLPTRKMAQHIAGKHFP